MENINKAIPILFKKLKQDNWLNFSKSILTTDTCIKLVSKKIQIKNEPVVITGVAKGSGMIMPNMATMLSFVATNLKISKKELVKFSFEFLLEREPNTAILSSFDLIQISKYFPEYFTELRDYCSMQI